MISVVIPARNESATIGRCLESVREQLGVHEPVEIIVADNQSTDGTGAIAASYGAGVVVSHASSVAGVRNDGVRHTTGEILLFLDADCFLGKGWKAAFDAQRERLLQPVGAILGSHPYPPPGEDVFLWRYWFFPYVRRQSASHVGSAHLVCSRSTFESLNGFNEHLKTGEDYDICQRLISRGGEIVVERSLVAFHDGYPRHLLDFVRREMWHGVGDVSSIRSIAQSRVALAGLLFLGSLCLALASLALGWTALALSAVATSVIVAVASAVARFKGYPIRVAVVASVCILPLYLIARGAAVAVRLKHWK